ncbi:polymorphic toxin-type HINT domain-containing protein [Micromonospora lupini]|uniref:RHS repeat-associated core domain-containing protein n=1 Tax=Micromonospora lupini TaxID=285679 RepID=UPI00225109AF|nr:LamG-like jellyroll fold domain-containing protein [Micromonospora lupini]MCX5069029.1 polymorphic toxin-type HINT domain-containing protein [Micromonospora lupini]
MSRRLSRSSAGLVGLLSAVGQSKLVAVGVTVALLAGAVSGSAGQLPVPERGRDASAAAPPPPGPKQQWGSVAADRSHLDGAPANRTLPATLRSRYPSVTSQPKLNSASVAASPTAAAPRGFDPAKSRELPAARTANERTYDNGDGTQTTEFSETPINYRTANGDWQPIDTRLVASRDATSGWHNGAGPVDLRFAARSDAADLVRIAVDGTHTAAYGIAGAADVPGSVAADGSVLTYAGVRPHVDVRLASQPSGVKETLVLTSPAAQASYLFPLRLTGLTAAVTGGQVVLSDAAGTPRAVIPAGDMVDSRSGAAGPARSRAVSYHLVDSGGGPALEVRLDADWLRDPARVYPVLVDPTVQLPVDGAAATDSMYVQGGSSAAGTDHLLAGNVGGASTASYLKFTDLVSRLQYHTIFGAQLWLVNYDAASCSSRSVTVHPVTGAWSGGSGYSYPGPAVGAALTSRSFAHGYIGFGQSSSACPTAGELFNLGSGGRDLVQRWVDGTTSNYGLSVRAATSDTRSGKWFTGTATANPPRLYVTHSPYNATYSIPNPVPNPVVLQNQAGKIKVTVTNKSAAAWAPADYYLAYRAYNAQTGAAVTQQRSASLPGTVARNGRVTLDATIKALPPGKYFLDFTMVRNGGPVFTDQQVPPIRLVLEVFDIPPVVQELYPPNGYRVPTLTPQLWARALDVDAPPSVSLKFKFEVCASDSAGKPVNCVNSGYQAGTAWTVPVATLRWSQTYLWRTYVKDATTEVISPYSAVLTAVPQPEITGGLAGAPYATEDQEYDPQSGNYTTSAVDATVATVGPELRLVRTYNSLDPRRDGLFGAGWTTRYDMRLVTDDDGSGNVVVTYPDGQAVRFGRNADGSYAAPTGRIASLTNDGSSWKLLDNAGTTYQFSVNGRLNRITDMAGRAIVLTYDLTTGKLAKAQVSNSRTNTAGRALTFGWTGNHITAAHTDPVNGTTPTWSYTYSGDLLTKVCAPDTGCTGYDYSAGSHYRSAVLDSGPEAYWRLGEAEGTAAGSEVAVNLGKDAGTYSGVTLGTTGPLAGTADTAATFNGTSSRVDLPKGTLKKSRDSAVELWFRASSTGGGGPLLGYQDKAVGTAASTGVPILYVGTDGKLHGQFAGGAVAPIASANTVVDGRWHHAVLSAMGTTQTLYLDGSKAGELTGRTIDASLLTFNQIGAAYASTPGSWPGWGSVAQRSFSGAIDDVAIYSGPLGPPSVAAHYRAGAGQADQLAKVTLPSGKVASSASYDVGTDRVKEYTDDNGGTWRIGRPTVYGNATDLRRSVEVLDPANRPSLYEYDAIGGWVLRIGLPLGIETRDEDQPGEPTPPPSPPVQTCTAPDPNDPAFCTVIPGDSGGPVFVRYDADGTSIRSFSYDEFGNLSTVIDENGDGVWLTYDDRGNVTSQKTCRTATECHTSYSTYPAVTNPYDPRNDRPTEVRDARSASATDNTYRTAYTYHSSGQLASQTLPDGTLLKNTYTTGAEAAVGGGSPPAGLQASSINGRNKVTQYAYYANGDLARTIQPSGLVTEYTYDALGRQVSVKEISDSYPNGVLTTQTYDAMSRPLVMTEPATTDAVTGVRHQRRTTDTYDLDGNGTKVEVADAVGPDAARASTVEYDEHNRPSLVTDAEGGQTAYNYDVFGNRTSEADPNGNRYDYAFTARNALAEVRLRDWHSDPAGVPAPATGDYLVLHSYSYDFGGRLASDTDAMGRRTEYEYYKDGLASRAVLRNFHNPDGSSRDFVLEQDSYDGAGHLTQQVTGNGLTTTRLAVDRLGRVTSTTADPGGLARTETSTYDGNGNVTRVTRTGKPSNVPWTVAVVTETVDRSYDDGDNLIEERTSDGGTTRRTTYGYDQRGLQTAWTDPRGNATGADPAAFTTSYTYDELGRPVTTMGAPVSVESNGQPAATARPVTTTGYDTFDEQTELRDPVGNVSGTGYDRVGRAITSTAPSYQPPAPAEAVIPISRMKYDANGNVVEVTDPRGNVTRSGYDQLNRLVTLDKPASTNDERAVTSYSYTRTGMPLATVDPLGARVESTYDDLDRPVTSTAYERKPSARTLVTRTGYDDAGNVSSTLSPTGALVVTGYDTLGQPTKSTDSANVVTQLGYDYAGRQVRASDGLGRTHQSSYDLFGQLTAESDRKPDGTVLRTRSYGYDLAGNRTDVTDALTTTSTYAYDAANQLIRQIEPVNTGKSITTTFGYDAAGDPTRYTDGRQNVTVTTYNSLGLPELQIEPSTSAQPAAADRTFTTAYDAAGNPRRLIQPGGVQRTRTYDAANRLSGEIGSGAEANTAARTVHYDLAGQVLDVNAASGTNAYDYDDRGNLLGTTGPGGTAAFGYDGDGNRTSRSDSTGAAVYTYTNARLTAIQDGLTGATQKIGYDAAGAVKTIDYGAGRLRTFGYDDFGRSKSDTLANQAGQSVSATTYDYDLADRLRGETTAGTAGAGARTYTYDLAGRLTGQTDGGTTTPYDWDDAGNRIKAGAKTASFDERNRLRSDGDYTYTYTARGSLRSRTSSGLTEQFSYDAFDRLLNAGAQTYTYDGLDRVAARNGATFTYAGQGDEVVSDGVEKYARGPGDELLATGKGSTQRLSLTDDHGDVVGAFDPTDGTLSKLPDSTAYDPFGKVTATAGDTGSLGFQGDWTDDATGQVDMGARWYNPGTGAFDSRDDVSYDGGASVGANRYTYGNAAPLNYTDPDGHRSVYRCHLKWGWLPVCRYYQVLDGCDLVCQLTGASQKMADAIAAQARAQERVAHQKSQQVCCSPNPHVSYPSYAPAAVHGGSGGGGGGGGSGCGACYDPAAARQRAYDHAKAVSDAARASNASSAKNSGRPVSRAARTPALPSGSVISSTPHLPAKSVSGTKDVVADARNGTDEVYQKAVRAAGSPITNVSAGSSGTGKVSFSGGGGGGSFSLGDLKHIDWGSLGDSITNGDLVKGIGNTLVDTAKSVYDDANSCLSDENMQRSYADRDWAACGWTAVNIGGLFTGGEGTAAVSAARTAGRAAAETTASAATKTVSASCAAAGNSFTGDTPVRLADGGSKQISEVRIGDRVEATDPTTGRTAAETVTDVITGNGRKAMTEITVDTDGSAGDATGTVTATDGHPFWVADQHRWVTAKDLVPGARIKTDDHHTAVVLALHQENRYQTVYNLTVDTLHTFYVVAGDSDLLVHNFDLSKCRQLAARAVGPVVERTGNGLGWVTEHYLTDPLRYVKANAGRATLRCVVMPVTSGAVGYWTLGNRVGLGVGALNLSTCVFNIVHDAWPTKKPPKP